MEYQNYIDLGFVRHDLQCTIEFKRTGYYGFSLEKNISETLSICVTSGNLDKPKLYIKKRNEERYHIITINYDMVVDLLAKPIILPNEAC